MLSRMKSGSQSDTAAHRFDAGLWLKGLREMRGISQRELAATLALDYYTFISQLENGRGRIPAHRYRDWAEALHVDEREFVKKLLSFYDSHAHDILFGSGERAG